MENIFELVWKYIFPVLFFLRRRNFTGFRVLISLDQHCLFFFLMLILHSMLVKAQSTSQEIFQNNYVHISEQLFLFLTLGFELYYRLSFKLFLSPVILPFIKCVVIKISVWLGHQSGCSLALSTSPTQPVPASPITYSHDWPFYILGPYTC